MLGIETAPLEALGRVVPDSETRHGPVAARREFLAGVAQRRGELRVGPDRVVGVDTAVAEDMLAVLKLAKESHRYPGDLGFEPEIKAICRLWRSERTP